MALKAVTTALLALQVLAHPTTSLKRSTPYSRIVAFGDDFTDNGQGSYAHGITGNETTGAGKHLWGNDTWTDGPVSVTYLAQMLGIPISYDYAFGSEGGADKVGSVCNNSAIPTQKQKNSHAKLLNGMLVPDALSQITNYTRNGDKTDIDDVLHFFWTGNNDMIASLGWVGRFTICDEDKLCIPGQQKFIAGLVNCLTTSLNRLVALGAKNIIVPNIYPRHLSPWQLQYISSAPGMMENFGNVIDQTNTQLRSAINSINSAKGTNIMYFDAFSFLVQALDNPSMVQGAAYNTTCPDGCVAQVYQNQTNWNMFAQATVVQHKPNPFFWMTTVMPSSIVLKALAAAMAAAL